MTIKTFAEKHGVSYNDVYNGLRIADLLTTHEKSVEYDEKDMLRATKGYYNDRLIRLFAKENELIERINRLNEAN